MKIRIHRFLFLFSLIFCNYLQTQQAHGETVNTEEFSRINDAQTIESSEVSSSLTEVTLAESAESSEMSSESVSVTQEEYSGSSIGSQEEPTTEPSNDRASVSVKQQIDEDSWTLVNNVQELQSALDRKEAQIKLAASTNVFDLGSAAIKITGNVTIDGNNRQISYDGGILNENKGLYTEMEKLTIKLQNMTFGSPDFKVPAIGLYGIMQSKKETNLHLENVNYYSSQGAQPLHLRHQNSKVFFHKVNQFIQQKADGTIAHGQEFAETNNLIFETGSQTTIVQNTTESEGFIWMPSNPSGITLMEEAKVNITTNHSFIYSDGTNNGSIAIGKNAKLSVRGTNAGKGNFYSFDRPAFWTVGENAEFTIDYSKGIKLKDGSTIKFMKGSVGDFTVRDSESVFDRDVGADSIFEIDNAKRLRFQGRSGSSHNPIGFVAGQNRFLFHSFTENIAGYRVDATGNATTTLTPQRDAGGWSVEAGNISRSVQQNTPDFTSTEKRLMKEANVITLSMLNFPVKLNQVFTDAKVNEADFQLSDYQLNGNDGVYQYTDFKLYSKKTSSPADQGEGFITGQQSSGLNDKVTFSDLKERTDYWLYVRIVCDPDSQSSEWVEIPFKTQPEKINVTFPVEVAFHTKKVNDQQRITEAGNYVIENHSSFPVKVQATNFKVLSNPTGINLLPEADDDNQKDLFLNLTEGERSLGALTEKLSESPKIFNTLTGKSSTTFGFLGTYYGNPKEAQKVQYQLTLTAERRD